MLTEKMLINKKMFCAFIVVVEWVTANTETVQGNNNKAAKIYTVDRFKLNTLYVQTQKSLMAELGAWYTVVSFPFFPLLFYFVNAVYLCQPHLFNYICSD